MSETRAVLRGVRLSVDKGRLVADLIRGKQVDQALNILTFTQKKAAGIVKKVLESAIANAEHNDGADIDDLKVKTIFVEQGTTLADFVDRSLGIGYGGGSSVLLALLLGTLFCWQRSTGSVSVVDINSRRSELFYWLTITFSQTLGTALGDWAADTRGLGYAGGMVLFGGLLALVAALHLTTRLSRTLLFWAAFILTRPLGAVVGDFLDKPLDHGGLALSRYAASLVLLIAIVACIALLPQRAARRAH